MRLYTITVLILPYQVLFKNCDKGSLIDSKSHHNIIYLLYWILLFIYHWEYKVIKRLLYVLHVFFFILFIFIAIHSVLFSSIVYLLSSLENLNKNFLFHHRNSFRNVGAVKSIKCVLLTLWLDKRNIFDINILKCYWV